MILYIIITMITKHNKYVTAVIGWSHILQLQHYIIEKRI